MVIPKPSTITLTTQLPNCQLELLNVGKYLQIDETIVGIKYNYANFSVLKGHYSTALHKKAKLKKDTQINKRLFYNQVSLVMCINGHNVNVKLFNNGSIHVTGCKREDEGIEVAWVLYSKLCLLKETKRGILLTKDTYGVLLDVDNLVYTYSQKKVIGYKTKPHEFVINRHHATIDHKTGMFLTTKEQKERKRYLYNFDGDQIGYTQIELLNNRNKYYKKYTSIVKCPGQTDLIYFRDIVLVGKNTYVIESDSVEPRVTNVDSVEDILEIDYRCCPFVDPNYTCDRDQIKVDIHCINVHFNIGYTINRQRLSDELSNKMYLCKYKPECYTGVKLVFKMPCFICCCSSKCTCTNVTFLIFQTGNVIGTGFRSQSQIEVAVKHFTSLLEMLHDHIILKDALAKAPDQEKCDPEIEI
ncbi:MAG: hypothetical protein EBU90_10780 [Proteobacteria bacterium]|nr:hypothetical protein [Pseudomonadota bacterium]NBP14658.1 hypothetical protein [bacterium]